MKLKTLTIGFFTGLILSVGRIDKAVTVPVQDIARLAKLTPAQAEKLVSLDGKKFRIELYDGEFEELEFRVIVPTHIPSGFNVVRLETVNGDKGASYTLTYRNSNNICFVFKNKTSRYSEFSLNRPRMQYSKPTDIDTVFLDINSSVISDMYLESYEHNRISAGSEIVLISSDRKVPGFELKSPCTGSDRPITVSEAVKIVESLEYLNP